jgi:26S proteasome regulatory subunit N2
MSHAAQNEVVQHGACLGLGVAAMASHEEEVFEDMKQILYTDSAVAGEAAGLAMGMVMLGTNNAKAVEDMVSVIIIIIIIIIIIKLI